MWCVWKGGHPLVVQAIESMQNWGAYIQPQATHMLTIRRVDVHGGVVAPAAGARLRAAARLDDRLTLRHDPKRVRAEPACDGNGREYGRAGDGVACASRRAECGDGLTLGQSYMPKFIIQCALRLILPMAMLPTTSMAMLPIHRHFSSGLYVDCW